MLEFLNISHKYDKKVILNDFSFKLEKGEIVSLLGPSGCGKTTLLKLASGIEKLQKGEIKLNDEIVSSLNFHLNSDKRQIGYVFQDFALFPHLTVMENIFFGISKNNIKKISQKIQKLMDEIDISNLANNYPHELSGGQQQQVALIRAMSSNPKIIFLDEPYSNLDSRLKEKIRDQMLHILREHKISVLLVTHDPEEAMFMSNKIGVLNNGCIEQFGTPLDIYLRPKSAFVAEFFGDINIFDGIAKEGSVSTVLGNFGCSKRFNDKKVKIIIRDEAIKLFSVTKINLNAKDKKNYVKCPHYGYVIESRLLAGSSLVHLSLKLDELNFHIHAKIPGLNFFKVDEKVIIKTDSTLTFIFEQ